MIYEYAIHPEFILELLDKNDLLLSLHRSIGIGTPCIASEFPKETARVVRKIIAEKKQEAKIPKEKAKWDKMQSNATEIMKKIFSSVAVRHGASAWDESFCTEHARHPFQGILAPSVYRSNPAHKDLSWLRLEECEFFSFPMTKYVLRTASGLGEALKALLQNSSELTFVDPYFGPEERYINAYKEYFRIISSASPVRSKGSRDVNIVCLDKNIQEEKRIPEEEFKESCMYFFQKMSLNDIKIKIYRVKERQGDQEFHNRYLLTDIGGVTFGHGTDEAKRSTNSFDNISILPADAFARWKTIYTPCSRSFVWPQSPIESL